VHLERDRAQRIGIQRRADRRNHLPVGSDVAHEAAALHAGYRQARAVHREAGARIAQQIDGEDHQRHDRGQHADQDSRVAPPELRPFEHSILT
jgi:hypothetical protein